MSEQRPTAVVTGGSSGIGAATGRALAAAGFHVVLGARRVPRLQEIADEIDGTAIELDVLDPSSVEGSDDRKSVNAPTNASRTTAAATPISRGRL